MGRRISMFVGVLSLALCAGLIVLWARGYRAADAVTFVGPAGGLHGAASHRGHVVVVTSDVPSGRAAAWGLETLCIPAGDFDAIAKELHDDPAALEWSLMGFKQ